MREDACVRIVDLLPEYDAGLLREAESERVAAHLERCGPCRREAVALQRTREILSATRPLQPARDLWQEVARGLAPRRVRPAWWAAVVPTRRGWSVVGVAATLLVLVIVGLVAHPLAGHLSAPGARLVMAADADTAQYVRWHAKASMAGGLADRYALALLVSTGKPAPTEPETP